MVSKMRSKKTLKELLKLDLETIEAMAPNPFRFTRIDVVVSLRDPEYCKVNRAAIKATKRSYCKEDRAILKRFSKALKMHYSLGKACTKENQGKRMLNKKNAASSPSIGSILASTSHSTGSTLASTSTTKTDIPKLLEIFKAIIASLKGFDVTFVMQRKLTKTDLDIYYSIGVVRLFRSFVRISMAIFRGEPKFRFQKHCIQILFARTFNNVR
ncbi:hypothetical protein AHAS_Ahas17G0118900 [Arachis hypogaea]